MHWFLPPPGWLKLNNDGSTTGSLGLLALGGIFRNCRGFVTTCFHVKVGMGLAFEAEIITVIYALDLAQARDLNFIWLVSDSMYAVVLLRDRVRSLASESSLRSCCTD